MGLDELGFIFKTGTPELLWNDIEPDKDKLYKVKLKDITEYRTKKVAERDYLVFKCELLKGFDGMGLDNSLTYEINLPFLCFRTAWERAPGKPPNDINKIYNATITFKRPTKKKMIILTREFNEVNVI